MTRCPNCGKEFTPSGKQHRRRFCSLLCMRQYVGSRAQERQDYDWAAERIEKAHEIMEQIKHLTGPARSAEFARRMPR